MTANVGRVDRLELDLDTRMLDLWEMAYTVDEWTLETAAAYMRAAYGRGYIDALSEKRRGLLMHDHGYTVPGRHDPGGST